MLKYIQKVVDRLTGHKTGITGNLARWEGQPDSPDTVKADIKELGDMDLEIEKAKDKLQQLRGEAHELSKAKDKKADATEKRAIAIHADDPDKLNEYNIKLRKEGETVPVPGKAHIESVEDDVDGEGFIIRIAPLADAETFEVQRGVADDPSVKTLEPPYPFYKSVHKLKIVDDDVEPGKRYFYRTRGSNHSGEGEWSEPVSAVQ